MVTALMLTIYVAPVLLVFAVGSWIAEVIERRWPPQNRRVRR